MKATRKNISMQILKE